MAKFAIKFTNKQNDKKNSPYNIYQLKTDPNNPSVQEYFEKNLYQKINLNNINAHNEKNPFYI
jgi:hypothetical protein